MDRSSDAFNRVVTQRSWSDEERASEHSGLRVLFTAAGLTGHFQPLVPFARGLKATGHTVAFATAPYFVPTIEAAGFRCFPIGSQPPPEELRNTLGADLAQLSPEEQIVFARQWFFLGEQKRQEIHDLLTIVEEWKPALIVREETEFAGCIAAERASLPHAAIQISVRGQAPKLRAVSPPRLAMLRAEVGLPPDPNLESFERYLYLSPFPPSLRHFDSFVPATQHVIQPAPSEQSDADCLPEWARARRDRPLAYATLGTAFNHRVDVIERILAGLRDESLDLVVTVGHDQDPAQFGAQPLNVHIERYIPQHLLYPHCTAAVIHGGSGTMIGALQHGLPLVVVPLGADQPANATSAQAAGVARVLDVERMTPEQVREAVYEILRRSEYRDNARRIQAEIAGLPPFAHGLCLLEQLARRRVPLYKAA